MPSTHTEPDSLRRRQALAGIGAALTGSLAGCTGHIPGTGPETVDTVSSTEADRLLWRYPPTDDDSDGIGYAAVEFVRLIHREQGPPAVRLELNSTVGGIAASEPHTGYRLDWFRFRLQLPSSYRANNHLEMRVEPPGQWEEFAAYYDMQGGSRQFVVELRNVDTQGSIIVPVVLDPQTKALPEQVWCSVTVQAFRPGIFGETVQANGDGTLRIPVE